MSPQPPAAHALVIRSSARARTTAVVPLSTAELMRDHLARVRAALPFDAAQVLVFDRTYDEHREVAQIGYPVSVARAMEEEFTRDWPKPAWYPRDPGDDLPPTISAEQDLPISFLRSDIYRDHLAPAGYRDGLTLELSHRGRYVGLANFSAVAEGFYTTDLRRRSTAFVSLLGHAVSSIAHELEAVPATARAAVIDVNGAASGLQGRDMSTITAQPGFVDVLRPMFTSAHTEVAFLWVVGGAWHRVLVRRHTDESVDGTHQLVIIDSPTERPYGLTLTEVKVLTRMITCATNDEVAAAMGTSVRTVHTHVSNILGKLGCDRRGQAVASAIRNALFLPDSTPEASLKSLLQ